MVPVQVIIEDADMDKLKQIALESGRDIPETIVSVMKQGLDWEEKARVSPRQFKEYIITLQNFSEYQKLAQEQLSAILELAAQGTDLTKVLLTILVGDREKAEAILNSRLENLQKTLKEEVRK